MRELTWQAAAGADGGDRGGQRLTPLGWRYVAERWFTLPTSSGSRRCRFWCWR
ncbi:hypothetical protein LNP25_19840 [Klebsiella variicola subsp. variicola]|nr:hypothetical protein [Klebsiella variicola subsp. variicola]